MVVSRVMSALSSVVLLWSTTVSASVTDHGAKYLCSKDGGAYTQQVMVGPSVQVRSHNNGRLQETMPGSAINQQAQAAVQANGHCTPLREMADNTRIARVHFAFDQAGLSDTAVTLLDEVSLKLRASHQFVVLEGHTDNYGTEAYNQLLGQQRAERVAEFLAKRGVAPERLVASSQGETSPVRNNLSSAERSQNRRVDVIVHQ